MIGIIDSGIGGKGIEGEIKKLLPNVEIEYLADTKNFPYGTKTVKVLRQILSRNIEQMIESGAQIIVLACNSATVSSVKYLRKKFSIPIVGVVPAIKTAAKITKTKNIAIFATPITSKSAYQQKLIDKYCPGMTVYKIPFRKLASLIEQGKTTTSTPGVEVVWSKYRDKNIDTIVLGCTHYTLIRDEIQKIVGPNIRLVDSNSAVAKQVQKVYNKIYRF
jgi:glutamate racemase